MRFTRIQAYVFLVSLFAALAASMLVFFDIGLPERGLLAIGCMVGWGLIAQLLAHSVGAESVESIASMPYLAGAFLVANWELLAAILVAESVVAMVRHRGLTKAVFNIAQTVLGFALAICVYRLLGGTPLLEGGPFHPIAFTAGIVVAFATNTLAVSGAVAISETRPLGSVWRAATRGSLFYNFLAAPLPYFFAQLFIAKGIFGALLLAVPLLAVRQIFRTAWRLEQATQDLLQLMVKAIEARDPYTSGHSRRVEGYSQVIGRAAGLSGAEIERLGKAALLHDVGKIHEMYAPILRKPDKLTPEEWDVMRTHPEKSAELVSAVSHLRAIVPAVRHHHENWDGSGYPARLRGSDIPLFSRIIAIADTIDAMTTDRPYRTARTLEQVRAELTRMAGRQFDPDLCAALLNGPFFAKLAILIEAKNGAVAAPGSVVTSVLRSA
ncbi:MAG: HD-GYP domain-containing protein [Gemmatimonadaceae bacterium]|nr:HD-GYP domain-containing protein [Gemmatimonadaceae bacterium]